MSLMSALNISAGALSVNSLGLQVVSNNISNVNTPGYTRQTLHQQSGPTYKVGDLTLGSGVQALGIQQSSNQFLDAALREAIADAEGSEIQNQVYQQLETILGELGENDLSTYLSDFFNSLNEVANQPESLAIRDLAIQSGVALADKIQSIQQQTLTLQSNINSEVAVSADRINHLLGEIDVLNQQIANLEGSNGASAAAPLRDTRRIALKELGSLIDIRTTELETGVVNINTSTGESLLFNGEVNQVGTRNSNVNGQPRVDLVIDRTGRRIDAQTGRLGGLRLIRDNALEDFLGGLGAMTENLIHQFNRIHSSGQGLQSFDAISSQTFVTDRNQPLNQAGLPFPAGNGSFKFHVRDQETGTITTSDIYITLGEAGGTSLQDLADQLNQVSGVEASIDYRGQLQIQSTDPNARFYFSNDTSGTLASLGINTFFTGSNASDIRVNSQLQDRPSLLAVSAGGVGNDSQNILNLISLEDQRLEQLDGNSIRSAYETLVGSVAQKGAIASDIAEGFRQYADSIEGQVMAISGVNLDEEAVKMMQYQRAYQASARVVQTVNEMFDVLVNL